MTIAEKLERLHNGPTRYELIAERGDKRILIAYCMRTGRRSILEACRKHGQKLCDVLGMDNNQLLMFYKPAKLGAHIGPAENPWSIRFSGRTQREAIYSELPWIGETAEQLRTLFNQKGADNEKESRLRQTQ